MKVGPRYKICKRLGSGVYEKCQTQKFQLSAARRGKGGPMKHARSFTDYGKQLLEKQRVRFTYGISERQLSRYVKEALEAPGTETIAKLYGRLETRLDNTVYRLGLAPTRRMARQLVAHGHIMVNGRRVTVPSYTVSSGDKISVRPQSAEMPVFKIISERLAEYTPPQWLARGGTLEGSVVGQPATSPGEGLDLPVVMEFYSR